MKHLKLFENFTNNIEIVEVFNGQLDTIIDGEEISFGIDDLDIYFLTDEDENIATEIGFNISDNTEYLINIYKKELADSRMRRFGFFKQS